MSNATAAATQTAPAFTSRKNCLFCGQSGTVLHEDLSDRLFGVEGLWNLIRCPGCHLTWLDPQPLPADIEKLYKSYYTHDAEDQSWHARLRDSLLLIAAGGRSQLKRSSGILGSVLMLAPPLQHAASTATLRLGQMTRGKLLDVGCGDGRLLRIMRTAGWQVEGVEPDPKAADLTRTRLNLPIDSCPLEELDLDHSNFDVVTLNHVIEHLSDPLAGLASCRRALRPGGLLIVLTPNIESLGHRYFGKDCVFLDPSRHLYLYSTRTLRQLAERSGFAVETLETPSRLAAQTFASSRQLRKTGSRHTLHRVGTAAQPWIRLYRKGP